MILNMYRGERFNSISHLVGAALALVGASVLVTVSAFTGSAIEVISMSIYGATLFLLYLASTLYHSFSGKVKQLFKLLDYQAIYLLIAGTYTPFALVGIQGTVGWWLLGIVWGLAVVGMIIELVPIPGPRVAPIIIYIVMGWACVFAFDAITTALSASSLYLLVAGGVVYTLGVAFFILDHWLPWCHEIWHIFVLGGSACHYFSVLLI